jgi:hypothetical protein
MWEVPTHPTTDLSASRLTNPTVTTTTGCNKSHPSNADKNIAELYFHDLNMPFYLSLCLQYSLMRSWKHCWIAVICCLQRLQHQTLQYRQIEKTELKSTNLLTSVEIRNLSAERRREALQMGNHTSRWELCTLVGILSNKRKYYFAASFLTFVFMLSCYR